MKRRQLVVACLVAGATLSAHAARAGEELPSTAEGVSPILVGMEAPDGALRTARGESTTLGALLDRKPAVLVFYRGHW